VNKIDHLCDVSIVLNPAYQQTLVDARSAEKDKLEHDIKRAIPEYQTEPSNKRSEAMIRDYDELDKIFKF
jgi:phage head maturation protease